MQRWTTQPEIKVNIPEKSQDTWDIVDALNCWPSELVRLSWARTTETVGQLMRHSGKYKHSRATHETSGKYKYSRATHETLG